MKERLTWGEVVKETDLGESSEGETNLGGR